MCVRIYVGFMDFSLHLLKHSRTCTGSRIFFFCFVFFYVFCTSNEYDLDAFSLYKIAFSNSISMRIYVKKTRANTFIVQVYSWKNKTVAHFSSNYHKMYTIILLLEGQCTILKFQQGKKHLNAHTRDIHVLT